MAGASAAAAAACGGRTPTGPGPVNPTPPPPPPPPPPVTPPTLRVSRILAFGDSITAGTTSPALIARGLTPGLPQSYPFKLQTLVSARYTAQTIAISNDGFAGKQVLQGEPDRFGASLRANAPELVVLIEGANDLNNLVVLNNPFVDRVLGAMEDMVRDARGRGIQVMIGTLPPQRLPSGNPGEYLNRYNEGIRTMAGKKDAILVDIARLLPDSLVGRDGLHPTEAGYGRLAEIFLDVIRQRFETAAPTTPSATA